jgi:hypothetical protein
MKSVETKTITQSGAEIHVGGDDVWMDGWMDAMSSLGKWTRSQEKLSSVQSQESVCSL